MHALYLKPKEHRRLLGGHLWVFSNELREVPRDIAAGETVQLFTHDGRLLGAGFFNPQSLIAFRLLTRDEEQPDRDFFRRKLLEALKLREKIYSESETNAWRLVHGESDGLPGLVIDRFDRAFVLQSFSAGIDQHLPLFCELLRELFDPKAIVVRNESPLRELEGLPLYRETVLGESSNMHQEIRDSGISYRVNILEGQKTGFFLDQRENRRHIRKYAAGADVLDVYTNDGGFALNAMHAGAKSTTMVDISQEALQRAEQNARMNGFGNFSIVAADAFETLGRLRHENHTFDLVVLDPPSFTKSRKTVPTALKAYTKLNRLGLQLVRNEGYLATASCSHHVSEEDFLAAIHLGAMQAGKHLRLISRAAQPPDHPVLLAMPETSYLKFACFYVTNL
ncbi:class I SAM-dependent rRNA methyltransferase [Chlorobaculum sp. MV4-Y]|uniref:class I SAM-dependent rRNA methyltransferase n=1 Tax=Chlorobaculum sp. MV4-Y TaxID=2976335 RepID=UPI0021AED137|nr:class I SAM-dependent rRNA methyltransferase [Chlorobaculum sp. MV4-Y]UWX58649.1 class I SAM-dependent rRNA methyltransferase [Chlorobaculum sp. MV4-Y]